MKLRLCLAGVLAVALAGCSTGYDAKPITKHTEESTPRCFLITRYDDGKPDGLGSGEMGRFCKAAD